MLCKFIDIGGTAKEQTRGQIIFFYLDIKNK